MRALSKASCVLAIFSAAALTASVADARSAKTARFGNAQNSVSTPALGSIPYDAEGSPFPSGHGGTTNSPDFQLVR
jgi:hypothetical protein